MRKHSDEDSDWDSQRMKIIGLGESSIRKSYYPELQQRLDELLSKNEDLNAAYEQLTATQEELQQNYNELANRERELVEKTNLLQTFFDGSPDMIYVHDADGRILEVNENVVRKIGFTRAEMMHVIPEDTSGKGYTAAMAMEKLALALRGESPEFEWMMKTREGREFPVEIRLRRLEVRNERGEPQYRILAIVRDITERRKAEATLRESEKKYRDIVETSPDIIWGIDISGQFTYVSPRIHDLLGYEPETLTGKAFFSLLPPDQVPLAQHAFEQRVSAGLGQVTLEVVALHADGRRVEMEIRSAPATDDEGRVKGFRGITRDITETRRVATALEQARKKMTLLNSVTFQDIQSAAFSLTAYHVLIKQLGPDGRISSFIDKESVLIQKISGSLDFAKNYQDMGMHPPRWQSVSQTFLFAISHLDFLKIAHTLDTENLDVFADPLFEKVFFNLMENVLHHGKGTTAVRLWYQEKADGIVLYVEDNGVGIPQEEKHMIFDRGYGKDTGLGLFLVREILSITGMSIRETGIFGQGTRFEIHIPKGAYRFSPGG